MSKAEETALGAVALIGIIIIGAYYLIKLAVQFFLSNWIIVLAVILTGLCIFYLIEYLRSKKINKEISKINAEVNEIRNGVFNDYKSLQVSNIIEMFDNAIRHFPKDVFLNPRSILENENLIIKRVDRVLVPHRKLEKITSWTSFFNNRFFQLLKINKLDIEILPQGFNPVTSFVSTVNSNFIYSDEYEMFVSIVSKNLQFSSNISRDLCIWRLLKERAEFIYVAYWESNYGHYFESSNSVQLEDLIKIYCDIHYINHLDKYTITMFAYYLIHTEINPKGLSLIHYTAEIENVINSELKGRKLESFEKRLASNNLINNDTRDYYSINKTDQMNGVEFENFIALLFKFQGYNTIVTPASGDQGIDVIAEKDIEKIGIQAKRYNNVVTNSAIQEVVAGMAHYKCNQGMVITNNSYTKSAIKLAESNNIILWDRQKLTSVIEDINLHRV